MYNIEWLHFICALINSINLLSFGIHGHTHKPPICSIHHCVHAEFCTSLWFQNCPYNVLRKLWIKYVALIPQQQRFLQQRFYWRVQLIFEIHPHFWLKAVFWARMKPKTLISFCCEADTMICFTPCTQDMYTCEYWCNYTSMVVNFVCAKHCW